MDIFKLPVHPQADIFPMLPDDEMQELAEDIKTNGLNFPVVVGEYEGKIHLIDGRNRRDACRIAGVEPEVQHLNGQDITAYIASSNLRRRNMTKSQQAMAMAMLYPHSQQGKQNETSAQNAEVKERYLRMARNVLRTLPSVADEVIAGGTSLNDAYQQARDIKAKSNSVEFRLEALRQQFPDIAELVDSGMRLEEAEAAARERETAEKMDRELRIEHLYQLSNFATQICSDANLSATRELFTKHSTEFERYTRNSLAEYLQTVQIVKDNILLLEQILEETIK